MYLQVNSTSGSSNPKKVRDPRQKDKLAKDLAKLIQEQVETEEADVAKIKDEAFKRAQSRSPTRQSPTSTSGTGNTPPQETSRDKRSRNLISVISFMKKSYLF